MNRTAARAILTILLLIVVCRAHAQTVVYTNDFETAVTTGWSTTITRPTFQGIIGTAIPRNGGRFLGEFGDQTIRLDLPLGLTVIPPHDTIRVVFDLYVIQTWDGNAPDASGPDIWSFGVAGAPPLIRTTFNNNGFATQAYPDSYPGGVNTFRTGARSNNTLGYTNFGDAIYRFDLRIPHSASTITLEFAGALRESAATANLVNESWGIDNIEVSTILAPVIIPTATLAAGDVTAAPGEIVDLPIRLRNARAIAQSGATSFNGQLRFDASLLIPVDAKLAGTVSNGERRIPLSLPVTTGPDSILVTIPFRVGLGSAMSTDLVLEGFTATGGTVIIDTVAGRFVLSDICSAGGTARLVLSGAESAIKISPNPAPEILEIDYSLAEDGPASLMLFDLHGSRVAVLLDEVVMHGEFRRALDLAGYPAGAYLLVLRTASTVVTRRLEIIR